MFTFLQLLYVLKALTISLLLFSDPSISFCLCLQLHLSLSLSVYIYIYMNPIIRHSDYSITLFQRNIIWHTNQQNTTQPTKQGSRLSLFIKVQVRALRTPSSSRLLKPHGSSSCSCWLRPSCTNKPKPSSQSPWPSWKITPEDDTCTTEPPCDLIMGQ